MSNFFMGLGMGIIPWYAIAILAACAYFLGNINPAILLGRAMGVDVRAQGSGNAGTTNALRSLGKKAGVITFGIDVVKGWAGYYLPLLLFLKIGLQDEGILRGMVSSQFQAANEASMLWGLASYAPAMLCGLCVVLGHMYPAAFGFRGGKGVATAFGVLLAASWLYALILLAIVVLFTAIFRRVSLSVLIAVAAALVLVFAGGGAPGGGAPGDGFAYFTGPLRFNVYFPLWVVILLALIVWKHRANIGRLLKGKEPKLSFGGVKKEAPSNGEGEEKPRNGGGEEKPRNGGGEEKPRNGGGEEKPGNGGKGGAG